MINNKIAFSIITKVNCFDLRYKLQNPLAGIHKKINKKFKLTMPSVLSTLLLFILLLLLRQFYLDKIW
ncbi:hypothetical protein XSR1_420010 [Xenorhabdus szentirmaii DSM 16338]|uniref:Uncharacterized protein n=1 Tax=Xenorhabdus szentirmaii DSM 16338 TaxID=1427518 RepID=W1J0J3_9GAMM|nr:hypothetical protein XSR1_420010 [Xenorhabdus szentirmaii DSM 16338]